MKVRSIINIVFFLASLSFNLFALWLTLGWKVRKTRKAFEKQLIHQGMAKKDAKRLSSQFSKMKKEMMSTLKRSFVRNI